MVPGVESSVVRVLTGWCVRSCVTVFASVGPLVAPLATTPTFAQLYVHDPDAEFDVVDERLGHVHLPTKTSESMREVVRRLLELFDRELRIHNTYIRDFVMAAEIMSDPFAPPHVLAICPDAAPAAAPPRVYNDFDSFNEVSIIVPNIGGLTEPPRYVIDWVVYGLCRGLPTDRSRGFVGVA